MKKVSPFYIYIYTYIWCILNKVWPRHDNYDNYDTYNNYSWQSCVDIGVECV